MQRFSLYGVHKRDYQESVTIGQTDARTHTQTDAGQSDPYVHTQTDAGQSDPYVPLCFAGDTKMIITGHLLCLFVGAVAKKSSSIR